MERFKGRVWLLGDDIDTDIIMPTEYLALKTIDDMKPYAFSPLRPELAGQIEKGDIIVAGKNFGCGSSREHAPLVLRTCGVGCVIARSFARIFYRNAINIGLPILECDQAAVEIEAGDQVKVDFDTGVITDLTTGKTYAAQPFPPFIQQMIACGGLMNSLAKEQAHE